MSAKFLCSRCYERGVGLPVSIYFLSWQLLNAMESADLTNHISEGNEKVSYTDLV